MCTGLTKLGIKVDKPGGLWLETYAGQAYTVILWFLHPSSYQLVCRPSSNRSKGCGR